MITDLQTFVDQWGYCAHAKDEHATHCHDCQSDPSQRSFDWSELLELNHERQVAIFGWCSCEQGERQHDDCPHEGPYCR
jgi:hypothetical protein